MAEELGSARQGGSTAEASGAGVEPGGYPVKKGGESDEEVVGCSGCGIDGAAWTLDGRAGRSSKGRLRAVYRRADGGRPERNMLLCEPSREAHGLPDQDHDGQPSGSGWGRWVRPNHI